MDPNRLANKRIVVEILLLVIQRPFVTQSTRDRFVGILHPGSDVVRSFRGKLAIRTDTAIQIGCIRFFEELLLA